MDTHSIIRHAYFCMRLCRKRTNLLPHHQGPNPSHDPFQHMYIANLLLVNFCFIRHPIPAADHHVSFYTSSPAMGDLTCTILLDAQHVLESVIIHFHAVIAVIRVWAITLPITYRPNHSRRVAVWLSAGV